MCAQCVVFTADRATDVGADLLLVLDVVVALDGQLTAKLFRRILAERYGAFGAAKFLIDLERASLIQIQNGLVRATDLGQALRAWIPQGVICGVL